MSRIGTEYLDAYPYDRLIAGDARFRKEPDEQEDEEEEKNDEGDSEANMGRLWSLVWDNGTR